jgi:hypothetical protein
MPSREATPLIWLDLRCTNSEIHSKLCPQGKPPPLIWLDLKDTDSKILSKLCPQGKPSFFSGYI